MLYIWYVQGQLEDWACNDQGWYLKVESMKQLVLNSVLMFELCNAKEVNTTQTFITIDKSFSLMYNLQTFQCKGFIASDITIN